MAQDNGCHDGKTEAPLYDTDLAYIHDRGFSGHIESWDEGLLDILSNAGIEDGTVVDLGCGGGQWVAQLAQLGFIAIGVDASSAMIDFEIARLPKATTGLAWFVLSTMTLSRSCIVGSRHFEKWARATDARNRIIFSSFSMRIRSANR